MPTPEAPGRRPNAAPNPVIEEIKDYDNLALRGMFDEAGLSQEGTVITSEDYDAIRSRAIYLAGENRPASAQTLLFTAFNDRLKVLDRLGEEAFRNISKEAFKAIFYEETGELLTDEEIEQFHRTTESYEEWKKKRMEMKGAVKNFSVAVEDDSVIGRGASPEEALRRAQEERE